MTEKRSTPELLFSACPPFEGSDSAQSGEYRLLARRLGELERRIREGLPQRGAALEAYQECLCKMEEYEARYYFQAGLRTGALYSGRRGGELTEGHVMDAESEEEAWDP